MSPLLSPEKEVTHTEDVTMITDASSEDWDEFHLRKAKPPTLAFISQTGHKIEDPEVKKFVRQNARSFVSREKGKHVRFKPLEFRLIVPESFGTITSPQLKTGRNKRSGGTELPNIFANSGSNKEIRKPSPYAEAKQASLSASPRHEDLAEIGLNFDGTEQGHRGAGQHSGSKSGNGSTKICRARLRGPKVKAGCFTCKTRHLKCDESKPSCFRCIRTLGKCAGYPESKGSSEVSATNRVIVPKPNTSQIFHEPSLSLQFHDETESQYFTIFRTETAIDLSGVFKSSFWDRLLLQESHHQDFVRHGIVSIAAFNKSIKSMHLANSTPEGTSPKWHIEAANQREYALVQYGKALQGMMLIPSQEEHHLRKLLIATLLVFVFETMHAQPDLAFWHSLIGDRMICKWSGQKWGNNEPRNRAISSPAASIIEDELLLTFCRHDTQLLTFVDTRGLLTHKRGMADGKNTVKEMPSVFSGLAEATVYWELVLRRSCHFAMYGAVQTKSRILQRDFVAPFSGRVIDMDAENSIYGSPYVVPDWFREEQQAYSADIDRWSASFSRLLAQIQENTSDLREVTNIAILRMYSLSIRIVVEGTVITKETSYDNFLFEFCEIVSLARMVSDNLLVISDNYPVFHFHMNVVSPLFIVLLKCRDMSLRREVIDILRMQQFDSPWDRFMIANIGSWIMGVEEAGADSSGYIPEEARVQLSKISMSMESRSVMVQCIRRELFDHLEVQRTGLEWVETTINDL